MKEVEESLFGGCWLLGDYVTKFARRLQEHRKESWQKMDSNYKIG